MFGRYSATVSNSKLNDTVNQYGIGTSEINAISYSFYDSYNQYNSIAGGKMSSKT